MSTLHGLLSLARGSASGGRGDCKARALKRPERSSLHGAAHPPAPRSPGAGLERKGRRFLHFSRGRELRGAAGQAATVQRFSQPLGEFVMGQGAAGHHAKRLPDAFQLRRVQGISEGGQNLKGWEYAGRPMQKYGAAAGSFVGDCQGAIPSVSNYHVNAWLSRVDPNPRHLQFHSKSTKHYIDRKSTRL